VTEETTTSWYYTYGNTSVQSGTDFYSSAEQTEIQTEETNKATLPLAIACAAVFCGVAALAVILIKRKK
jgi:zona occludens toxin (predicted ATPase)